ncbi:MAG: hypothetical protein AB7O26_11530 [Planctomycetaceae bacterium]
MAVTINRLISVVVFAAVSIAMLVLHPAGGPALSLMLTVMFCLPALLLIWFPELFGEAACFSRGIAHSSPPGLIVAMGWLFLLGYPLLVAYVIS